MTRQIVPFANQEILPPQRSATVRAVNAQTPAIILARKETPLATAAWHTLTEEDRYQAGGVLLGVGPDDTPVGFGDDRHVLIASGTRGGKGVSYLVPNLMLWPGSVLVIDPKGENAMVTARRRGRGSAYTKGMGQTVHILDPYGEVAVPDEDYAAYRVCFNPLDLLGAHEPESVTIAARIADSLAQVERSNDPFWEESARSMVKDLILHVASSPDYVPEDRNLATIRKLLRGGDRKREELARLLEEDGKLTSGFELLFDAMKRNPAFGGVVSDAGSYHLDQLHNAPRTIAGVIATAARALDFLDDPQMRACVSRSDFRLSDLKTDPKGVSLYVCLPERLSGTHYGWLRMLAALTIGEMERTRGAPASGHPVLMVLDEFPSLRRMRVIENAAAQIAGFGVKMMFVVQTLAQMKDIYKDNWETMVANAGVKIFFGNDDLFTCEYVSKLIGDTEIIRTIQSGSGTEGWSESRSFSVSSGSSGSFTSGHSGSMGPGGSGGGGQSFSHSATIGHSMGVTAGSTSGRSGSQTKGYAESIHKRPLVAPDELRRLFGKRDNPLALVLMAGSNPAVVRRLEYYREKSWRGLYDRHRDHPAPVTLAALPRLIADERKAAEDEAARRKRERQERARRAQEDALRREYELMRSREQMAARMAEEERKRRNEARKEFVSGIVAWACIAATGLGVGWVGAFILKSVTAYGWGYFLR